MLDQLLRSLGRRSPSARRVLRGNFSSASHRSETAIERLEERMLLSAATHGEIDFTTVDASENNRPRGGGTLIIWRVAEGDPVEFSDRIGGQDLDGDWLRFVIVTPPDVGTLEIDEDFIAPDLNGMTKCQFTFNGPDDWRGTTSFTYRVFDGLEYSDVMGVNIYVETDHPPTLEDQEYTSTQDQPVVGRLQWFDPESDQLFVDVKEPPKVGTLVVSEGTAGDFVYTPPKGFSGIVTFTYGVWGHWGTYSLTATVTIVIEPAEEPDHHHPPDNRPPVQPPGRPTTLPPVSDPPVINPPVTPPHSQAATSSSNDETVSSSNVDALLPPAALVLEEGDDDPSLPGTALVPAATIVVPSTRDPGDEPRRNIAAMLGGTESLQLIHLSARSLRSTQWHHDRGNTPDAGKPASNDTTSGRGEDPVALFDFDWFELWDGSEFDVLDP